MGKINKSINKIMKKLNKLSLPTTILIAGIILGGLYYASQVSKQKSIEKQQQVKIEQEQEAKEEAEQALNLCLDWVVLEHMDRWNRECNRLNKLTGRCKSLYEMTDMEYKAELNNTSLTSEQIHVLFLAEKTECSCPLPAYLADDINDDKDTSRAECFKRYPQE